MHITRLTLAFALCALTGCSEYSKRNGVEAAAALAAAGAATLLEGVAIASGSPAPVIDSGDAEAAPANWVPGPTVGPRDHDWHTCAGNRRYRLACAPGAGCHIEGSDSRRWRCDQPRCKLPEELTDWCRGE